MQFSPADIADILAATGEDIGIILDGLPVKTLLGKFRRDFETVSPFDANAGMLNPSFLCATADMVGITSAHTFVVGGVEYRMNTKPQDLDSGFTRVIMAKK
jgi:hypothetical protein